MEVGFFQRLYICRQVEVRNSTSSHTAEDGDTEDMMLCPPIFPPPPSPLRMAGNMMITMRPVLAMCPKGERQAPSYSRSTLTLFRVDA
jgi:hypothetical protein